ncbi:MAG: aspartate aminotransferase family protein [Bacteroidota bacterium]|nr:aspartate aminotransferase family protein [Bacteroidota bacterium]
MNRLQTFLKYQAQTNTMPLALDVAHSKGSYIYDHSGAKYLDLISGIGVSALGHSHPDILAAIHNQADKHLHVMVYGEYIQSSPLLYAQALTTDLPDNLNCVFFTNSGTEATEGALKLARRVTGKSKIVSLIDSYHGSSMGSLSLAGNNSYTAPFQPLLPDVVHIPVNDLERLIAAFDESVAAIIVEPVRAESGGVILTEEFRMTARQLCNAYNSLLIYDECQTGLFRTGRMWQAGEFDVVPDILLAGKSLGGGLPLGAFISSREFMATLSENPALGHITTFGGHPLSCASGLAFYTALKNEISITSIENLHNIIRDGLQPLHLHGIGLLLALELDTFDNVTSVILDCFQQNILTDWFLYNNHCIRLAPPLNIEPEDLKAACTVIMNSTKRLGLY